MKNKCLQVIGLVCLTLISFVPAGCQKSKSDADKTAEQPGKIPGMGNEPGNLTGQAFQLPKGISLKGVIVGDEDPGGNACKVDGSGENVMVQLTLQRDSTGSGPIIVKFPRGLTIVSQGEGYQNGILVEEISVPVPPMPPGSGGVSCKVNLLLQCLNKDKLVSDATASYKFGPITDSKPIKDFLSKLAGKKVTYSDYNQDGNLWRDCNAGIQDALWNITDGRGLTQEDLDFIRSLPSK